MGYDAGILVTQQITDEHKWFLAMQEVNREFKGESYFECMPEKECNLSEEIFKMLDLTEPLNFGDSGKFCSYRWKWLLSCLDYSVQRNVKAGKMSLKDALSLEEESLKKKMETDTDCRLEGAYGVEQKMAEVKLAMGITEIYEGELGDQKWNEPPVLYEFCVGEHPTLTMFGRHFQRCTSKISSSSTAAAKGVLSRIYRILKRHFPSNVRWWSELADEDMSSEPKFCKTDEENPKRFQIQKEFYENAPKLFDGVKDKESLMKARRGIVKVMLTQKVER